jgi:hypothetical protein
MGPGVSEGPSVPLSPLSKILSSSISPLVISSRAVLAGLLAVADAMALTATPACLRRRGADEPPTMLPGSASLASSG